MYIIGAGINQVVKHQWYNNVSPPMINNFFQVALNIDKFSNESYTKIISIIYDYIEKYWKKSKIDLSTSPFNLEECFSLIELQLNEAIKNKDMPSIQRLREIQYKLKLFMIEVLSVFKFQVITSETMRSFGDIIHQEKPTIITFNYDDFLENVLEFSSGENFTRPPFESITNRINNTIKALKDNHVPNINKAIELSSEEIGYHRYNWIRSLGYGIQFDLVTWDFAGPEQFINKEKFYSHPNNAIYPWKILKLHGSINWFRYLPIKAHSGIPGQPDPLYSEEKAKQIILSRQDMWLNTSPVLNGLFIDPIIITPTMFKEKQLTELVFDRISILWEEAKNALSHCDKLIVIGYSFPPTDFLVKKLFIESFSENSLKELIIVNPDTSVVQKIKDLCHHNKPVLVCQDLKEYVKLYTFR